MEQGKAQGLNISLGHKGSKVQQPGDATYPYPSAPGFDENEAPGFDSGYGGEAAPGFTD